MAGSTERARGLADALFVDAAETDREGGFPQHSIELLHGAGLLDASVATTCCDASAGRVERARELLHTLCAVGRGSLVVGRLFEGHVNALQLIERYGTPVQRERAAADASSGCLFAVWNTQADDGVRMRTTSEGVLLAGSKTFASGLGHASRAIVTAARDDGGEPGVQMLVVETDRYRPREERAFWRPLGMRATASFRADFTGLRLRGDALLGSSGDYFREPAFSGGAIRFAAVQQGGAEAVFDETRRFLRALGRTDDASQQARLGEMAWRIEAARLWLDGAAAHAAAAMASGSVDEAAAKRAVAYAHLMRSAIEEGCLRVLALAERSVGARGLLRPEPFERLHRDLTHYLRQPAPDAALVAAGRHVLGDASRADRLWPLAL